MLKRSIIDTKTTNAMKTTRLKPLAFLLCCLLTLSVFGQNYEFYNYHKDDNEYIDDSAPPFQLEYFAMGYLRIGMSYHTLRGLNGIAVPGFHGDVSEYNVKPMIAPTNGLFAQFMFQNQLLIEVDFSMLSVGGKLSYKDKSGSQSISDFFLQSRLLFGSKKVLGESDFVFLYGVGPYVSFSIGGSDGSYEEPFTYDGDLVMKRLDLHTTDIGLSAMLGLEISIFQMTLHYDHGLRNLARSGGKLYTSGLHLNVGMVIDF